MVALKFLWSIFVLNSAGLSKINVSPYWLLKLLFLLHFTLPLVILRSTWSLSEFAVEIKLYEEPNFNKFHSKPVRIFSNFNRQPFLIVRTTNTSQDIIITIDNEIWTFMSVYNVNLFQKIVNKYDDTYKENWNDFRGGGQGRSGLIYDFFSNWGLFSKWFIRRVRSNFFFDYWLSKFCCLYIL